VARLVFTALEIAVDGAPQSSETTLGTVGGHAIVITTALPDIGITVISAYIAAIVGDIAVSHIRSIPGGPPVIHQHVLGGLQPGETHAQACLLDHAAEVRDMLDAFHASTATVTVAIADGALATADRVWHASD